jgi:quinol-cytochrome oxidoreductase complex cytochrome b subunit
VGAVPFVGEGIKELLRGGSDVTGATLTRFYAFHIALLPAIFTVVLALHLIFVQRQGMHAPAAYEALPDTKKRDIPFFPSFLLRDVLLWLVVLNLLLYVAVFWPAHMGVKADAFSPAPEGIRPEWYFMFMFQTLKVLPAHILGIEGELVGILFFGVAIGAWLLVPFWEPLLPRTERIRPMTVIGVLAIIFIVTLTIWGYLY